MRSTLLPSAPRVLGTVASAAVLLGLASGPGLAVDRPGSALRSSAAAVAAADCSRPLQSRVDAAPAGSTLEVPACLYRETVTVDRPLTLHGPGAEIRGSDVWTAWSRRDGRWVSDLALPAFYAHGECAPGTRRCLWPEQVFEDGVQLVQVDHAPSPGEFTLDAGRHVVLGADPTGRRVEVTTRTRWVVPAVDGVVIEGFRMRHAANDSQRGAIDDDGLILVVRDCVLSEAHGAIVQLKGRGQLTGSEIFGAGQLGVSDGGRLVAGNRIHDNNTESFDPEWEAGGLKAFVSDQVVEDNEVYDNAGPGLWWDGDSQAITVRRNRVWGNSRAGIMVEISRDVVVRDNVVWGNGGGKPGWAWGAGILVSTSARVEVAGNTLAWNADGISVITQSRRDAPEASTGIVVRDNTILSVDGIDTYALAWLDDAAGGLFAAGSGNVGRANRFWYPTPEGTATRFAWGEGFSKIDAFGETPGGTGSDYLADGEARTIIQILRLPEAPVPVSSSGAGLPLPAVFAVSIAVGLVILAAGVVTVGRARRRGRR